MGFNLVKVIFCTLLFVECVLSANILFFSFIGTYSHQNTIYPLAEKLVSAGHKVSVLSAFKQVNPNPKIEHFVPEQVSQFVTTFVGEYDINLRLNSTKATTELIRQAPMAAVITCDLFLKDPKTKPWIEKNKFDLVIIDHAYNDCAYGIAYKYSAKVMHFSSLNSYNLMPEIFGYNHENLPEMIYGNRLQDEGILTTLQHWFLPIYTKLAKQWVAEPQLEAMLKEYLEIPGMPSITEMEKDIRLVLYNGHFSHDYTRSLPPMFVSISGIHIKDKIDPLPKNLQDFIGDKEFIYISLGSAVVSSKMPSALRDLFFSVIEQNNQYQFLWRWTGDAPQNAPKNLLLSSWLPQQDILAHPKIRAFVTQGGLPSVQESIYCGIPMVFLPIFADQDNNADYAELKGFGIKRELSTLTASELNGALKEITGNSAYKDKALFQSKLFKDRPMKALDVAFWWTEFVLRHDHTRFLQAPGMTKSWWNRYYLTPILVVFSSIFGSFLLLLMCISTLNSYFRKRPQRSSSIKLKGKDYFSKNGETRSSKKVQ